MSTEVKPYYAKQAKEHVDMLFDKGFLNSQLTRGSIDWLEDFVGFLFQSQCESAVMSSQLLTSLKGKQAEVKT